MNVNFPIVDVINFNRHKKRLVLNLPQDVNDFSSVVFDRYPVEDQYDLIFAFVLNVNEFKKIQKRIVTRRMIRPDGSLYFAFPRTLEIDIEGLNRTFNDVKTMNERYLVYQFNRLESSMDAPNKNINSVNNQVFI